MELPSAIVTLWGLSYPRIEELCFGGRDFTLEIYAEYIKVNVNDLD